MLAALSVVACAQTTTAVEVVDVSSADCPVRMSGEIKLIDFMEGSTYKASLSDHLVTTNASKKTVIAMVVVNHYGTPYGPLVQDNREFDTYFSHDLEIAPGKVYTHDHHAPDGTFSIPLDQNAERGTPKAESKVIFVQFADGTMWGDREDAHVQNIMKTRVHLSQILRKLDADAMRGQDVFSGSLQIRSDDYRAEMILDRIRERQTKYGIDAAVNSVREMLAVAATR
jgi:hypothetical protein